MNLDHLVAVVLNWVLHNIREQPLSIRQAVYNVETWLNNTVISPIILFYHVNSVAEPTTL